MSIRAAREKDLGAMLEVYRPYVEKTTYSFEYSLPSMEEFTRRFLEHTAQFPWLVWEEDGTVLGYAYAGAPWERAGFRWTAEVSIYLSPAAQGRGIGRRLYGELEHILKMQGYRTVYAIISTENSGSIAFHERLGYRVRAEFPNCGYKMGRWVGVVWMEKQINAPGNPEVFPAPWTQYTTK